MLDRIEVTVAPPLTAKYPAAWPARLTLILANGDTLRGEADFPRGNPENPVSTQELEAKFRALVSPRFGPETAQAAIDSVASLDQTEAPLPKLPS